MMFSQRESKFNWADDVEQELFSETLPSTNDLNNSDLPASKPVSNQPLSTATSERKGRYIPLFSVNEEDGRYQYGPTVSNPRELPTETEDPWDDLASQLADPSSPDQLESPESPLHKEAPEWRRNNMSPKKAKFEPRNKNRKRMKSHTLPTPGVRPSWEYEEYQATRDPFAPEFPCANQIIEPKKRPEIVENLWADYDDTPSSQMYF